MTFILVLILGLAQTSKDSFDQHARNAMAEATLRQRHVDESTHALKEDQLRDLASMTKALQKKN